MIGFVLNIQFNCLEKEGKGNYIFANINADGSINIPEVLVPYMGGMTKIEKKK